MRELVGGNENENENENDDDNEKVSLSLPRPRPLRSCISTALADAVYDPYKGRQAEAAAALAAGEALPFPPGLDFSRLPSLGAGDRAALSSGRPADMAAAARLPGVTPAALLVLLAHVKRGGTKKKKEKREAVAAEQ